MKIEFKEMKLANDGISVEIKGKSVSANYFGEDVDVKMSVLQLAKMWGTDRNAGEACEESGWGSKELEDKCDETKNEIKKFPDVKYWNKEIECYEGGVINNEGEMVDIYGEDISGWNNEGIIMKMSKEIYDKEIGEKKFKVILNPMTITLRVEK